MLQSEITINAPPRIVREILLDFPNLRNWHDGSFFTSISVTSHTGQTTGLDLKKGDKVKVGIIGMTFSGTIMYNEPGLFSWIGSLPYIFTGHHYFRFESDPSDPNLTLFSQSETFTGLLGFTSAFFSAKTLGGWEKLNKELKVAAETKWAAEKVLDGK